MKDTHKKFSVLKLRGVRVAAIVLALGIPIVILAQFLEIFLMIIFSIAFTLLLYPFVDYFEKKGLKRMNATFAVYGCLAVMGLIFYFIILPIFVGQVENLAMKLQKISIDDKIRETQILIHQYAPNIKADDWGIKIHAAITKAEMQLKNQVVGIVSGLSFFMLIPLFVFFAIRDFHMIQRKFLDAIPNEYFEMALNVIFRIEQTITKYMQGMFLDSAAVGLLATIGFVSIGLDYSLILGLLIGVFNIVPLIGPVIGGVCPVLVAVVQYGTIKSAIAPLIIFGAVRMIDGSIIRQQIYKTMLSVPPVLVLILVTLGNELMGVLGTILCIPIYTVISTTARETNWGLQNYKITSQ
jgi:predicted PurR-regulated permease PerM